MRLPCRLPLSLRTIFFLGLFSAAAVSCLGQTAPQVRPETASDRKNPPPPPWEDAAKTLAGKIASAAGSQRLIILEMRNISSFRAGDAAKVREELESQLAQHHIRVVTEDSAAADSAAPVQFTLSEGAEGFIWVAETGRGEGRQVAIVSVVRTAGNPADKAQGSLQLDEKLIWKQPAKFLDFEFLTPPAGSDPSLVILEPDQLAFYRSVNTQWEMIQTIPIPRSAPWPRDLQGRIDLSAKQAFLPGVECSGNFDAPRSVQCVAGNPEEGFLLRGRTEIPGHEGSVAAELVSTCGEGRVAIGTGDSDWTQPDRIQGYVVSSGDAVAAGSPIQTDGPVMALWPEGTESAARAIVYNLTTGNYEGYIVTATCSH
jgi:hypothetical protein